LPRPGKTRFDDAQNYRKVILDAEGGAKPRAPEMARVNPEMDM